MLKITISIHTTRVGGDGAWNYFLQLWDRISIHTTRVGGDLQFLFPLQ